MSNFHSCTETLFPFPIIFKVHALSYLFRVQVLPPSSTGFESCPIFTKISSLSLKLSSDFMYYVCVDDTIPSHFKIICIGYAKMHYKFWFYLQFAPNLLLFFWFLLEIFAEVSAVHLLYQKLTLILSDVIKNVIISLGCFSVLKRKKSKHVSNALKTPFSG